VRTNASRDGDLRISGLQLPDDAATGGGSTAAKSLAVNQTATYRWTLGEDLAGLSRAGIAGIGLYRPKVEEVEEEEAIDMIRSSGLAVSSLSWVGGFTGSDGAKQDEALYDAAEAVRFAAAVGAGTVGVISGGSGNHILKHARRLLIDALKRLCDQAGEVDVRLALHPMSGAISSGQSILRALDETLDVVEAARRPNLGFVFDLAELSREAELMGRISQVASYVHLVRLSDRRPRTDRRRFWDGPLPVAGTVQAFVDAGYDGPFEFDFSAESNAEGADYDGLLAACRSRFESFVVADDSRA
jgi:sugar phosphate isomerase/epimerase